MSTAARVRTPRYLGAAFVFQFATSLAAGLLSGSLLAGSIAEVLTDTSTNLGRMRTSIVLELLTSVGIIAMTSLLYTVLKDQDRTVALVALGLWMAEAIFLAIKTLALYALLDVSQGHSGAGTLATSSDQSLGSFALHVSQHAGDIDMLFFCLGALLWYAMLLQSRIVPRVLALWGLLAVPLVLVATVMLIWDRSNDPAIALYAPYVPFELVIGLWFLIKGGSAFVTQGSADGLPGMRRPAEVAKAHHPVG
jgi:Domain of unknown function (DUF4386)